MGKYREITGAADDDEFDKLSANYTKLDCFPACWLRDPDF